MTEAIDLAAPALDWRANGNLLVRSAAAFAVAAHGAVGQKRKYNGEPYHLHPFAVAALVSQVSNSPAMIAAALLHDVVEDTKVDLGTILDTFGPEVASLVDDLTDASRLTDGNREIRKAIDRAHSEAASPDAQTIKVADLIDNTRSIVERDPAFAKVYMAEKRLLLAVLTKADANLRTTADELIQAYERQTQLDQMNELNQLRKDDPQSFWGSLQQIVSPP